MTERRKMSFEQRSAIRRIQKVGKPLYRVCREDGPKRGDAFWACDGEPGWFVQRQTIKVLEERGYVRVVGEHVLITVEGEAAAVALRAADAARDARVCRTSREEVKR